MLSKLPRQAVAEDQADGKCSDNTRLRPQFAADDARKQAALYFASGWGYARTAKALNLPVNTVRDWNRAYKAGKFNLKLTLYVYDADFKKKVTAMRRSGASWREIKEKTGISPSTVLRWMKKEDSSFDVKEEHENAKVSIS